jgi:hypothetical protein
MARAGRGEVEFVTKEDEADPAADRFYERVHTPVLTDISIDWNGLPVSDVMPARALDLFSAKPLVVTGRYNGGGSGTIRLRGKRAGKTFEREIKVNLPVNEPANQALEQLWARNRIENLMSQDWNGLQQGNPKSEVRDEITQLGLDYRLVTQFTSFVAVEEQTVVEGGRTRTIQVPVEMPQGVSAAGVFGENKDTVYVTAMANPMLASQAVITRSYNGAVVGGVLGAAPKSTAAESISVMTDSASVSRRDFKKEKRDELESKLHPGLLAAYDCWLKSGKTQTANCGNLKQGRIAIQLWLTESTPAVMKKLQELGFVVSANKSALQLNGSLPVEKLQALAELKQVKLMALEK